jgi:hypothetical protein
MLDKPGLHGAQKFTASVGIEWGIFIALLLALGLLYVGRRIHASERGQPPLSRPRDAGPRDAERRFAGRRPQPTTRDTGRGDAETVVRPGEPHRQQRAAGREPEPDPDEDETVVRPVTDFRAGSDASRRDETAATAPVPAPAKQARRAQPPPRASATGRSAPREPRPPRGRPRFPPAPSEQMSFEDSPADED